MKIITLNLKGERMPKQVKDSPINRSTNARIQAWKDKKAKERPSLKFATTQDKENAKRFRLEYKLDKEIKSKHSNNDVITASLAALTGSTSHEYNQLFLNHVAGAMLNETNPTENHAALNVNAIQGGMLSMKPQDAIEAQLCAKLMVLQAKSMHFMNVATCATLQKQVDSNLNNATKCMRLHNETLEALNRYRRKGEQRVKVVHQYVQVNEGGQAVVAAEARGGAKQKKHKV